MAAGQLQLRQPQEIPDMIDTGLSAFMGLFLIFGEEGCESACNFDPLPGVIGVQF